MSVNGNGAQGWRIGVDIGGTFTDLVLAGPAGIHVAKVPSVPADPARGVLDALDRAASDQSVSVRDLLGRCALFVHGSTIATNTLLEGKGAKVGMLTTEGFRDSLEIRRGIRDNPWEHRTPYPPALVPRMLRRPVQGRIDRDGREAEAIAVADLDAAADLFRDEGVECGRDLPVQQLPQPDARGAGGRGIACTGTATWLHLGLQRDRADHGRVRARLDGGAERLCGAAHGRLPARPQRPPRRARPEGAAAADPEQRRRRLRRAAAATAR